MPDPAPPEVTPAPIRCRIPMKKKRERETENNVGVEVKEKNSLKLWLVNEEENLRAIITHEDNNTKCARTALSSFTIQHFLRE